MKGSREAEFDESTIHEASADDAAVAHRAHRLFWFVHSPDVACIGRKILLQPGQSCLIGRKVERDGIAINDPKMSRAHSRIVWDARSNAFRIADQGSANGTFVNGRRVSAQKLIGRAVIRLGQTVLVSNDEDLAAATDERLERVAATDLTVLLVGETGTGKERAARRLHQLSGRSGPLIPVNCAALPKELLAAEFFGHGRGAFSGAERERPGLFRAAKRGTLFLDEVGDLPSEFQPALLRALQERRVRPVGADHEETVDVRIVAAVQPEQLERESLRSDLLARLTQAEVRLAPLRARPHTLPQLIVELAAEAGMRDWDVTADGMELLCCSSWPCNVRDLQNLLSALRVFGNPPHRLDAEFVRREAPQLVEEPQPVEESGASEVTHALGPGNGGMSRARLEGLLRDNGGRASLVARQLGVSRAQVYRWFKRFGIAPPSTRC